MKQYLIDGLNPKDVKNLENCLNDSFGHPVLGNIYWVELDRNILTPRQKQHVDCYPHVFALELGKDYLSCELLVRIKKNIKCDCMGFANHTQRDWLIDKIDLIFDELGIII